jgi:hypothetical protein
MKKAASEHSLARYTYKMHRWKQQLTFKTLNLIELQTLKFFEEEESGEGEKIYTKRNWNRLTYHRAS